MKITVWTLASYEDGTIESETYTSEAAMHAEFWARIKRALQWRDDEIAELKHYAGDDLDEGYSEACNEYGMEITMTWGREEIDVPDAPTSPLPGNYLVRWEIDSFADTPEQAAREAWAAMRADGSIANVFTVTDRAGNVTGIDFNMPETPPPVSEETPRPPGTLPPDPDEQNDDRAEWAEQALERFQAVTGTDDCDAIGDLIADLKHLCDRKPELYGDFATGLQRGISHYEAETMPFELREEESANA